MINRISNIHPPIPPLIQDDSNVEYCNADEMPKKFDTAKDGEPITYCSHKIDLELGEVYEFLATDDECKLIFRTKFGISKLTSKISKSVIYNFQLLQIHFTRFICTDIHFKLLTWERVINCIVVKRRLQMHHMRRS